MFDKLFNLFRKKPAVIQEELPPAPNPYTPSVKKVSTTSSCCGGKCGPRPQKSKRQLKPVRERDLTPLLDSIEDAVYIASDAIAHNPVFDSRPVFEAPPATHSSFPSHSHSHDTPSHSHSYDAPSHSHSYDSGHSHDSGGYDSGGGDSGGGCDGGGGGCD